ncbi:hypothetical protein Sjap_001650 [Stephania japonica]|uniref:Uncharacterized protein n=1 Tax=Stephania japonica TaxID=461633 RepID=A0AAP0KMX0_9MAGN
MEDKGRGQKLLSHTSLNMTYSSITMITLLIALTLANNSPFVSSSTSSQNNCSYFIEIETTCAASAGTKDADIGIRFGDSSRNLVVMKQLRNPKMEYYDRRVGVVKKQRWFERCEIDMFETTGVRCMAGPVCALYLKQRGSDKWRPGWVKVLHRSGSGGGYSQVSYVFYYRTFVPENVWFGFDYCGSSKVSAMPHELVGLEDDKM